MKCGISGSARARYLVSRKDKGSNYTDGSNLLAFDMSQNSPYEEIKNENTENPDAIFSTNNKAEPGDALEVDLELTKNTKSKSSKFLVV